MSQQNLGLWHVMIGACVRRGKAEEALKLFRLMRTKMKILADQVFLNLSNIASAMLLWIGLDEFYTDVTAEGVDEGLKSLSQGGTPHFLIIDDGWQQIDSEVEDAKVTEQEGVQFASRLTGIKHGRKLHGHIIRNGFELDVVLHGVLIDMYWKGGSDLEACEMFD
ncbi:hypothetical protein KI387_034174 [Taxus chinensis]|uniref:Galactinol--sucrose galactosyltransferase n=1 Tax=Taxus chinensis TaxID=29808 RepID=A0AA38BWH6_TAXCH|nr:hypothetical protein KI387_034174 [Taxus chinensis]